MLSSCSSWRAWAQRASLSMTRLGPGHLVAANSGLVNLFRLAHRTKLPASTRAVAYALDSHRSRSPCPAHARSRPRAASQSSRVIAAVSTVLGVRFVEPLVLTGELVVLEPLQASHHDALVEAASDGQLWTLSYTRVPRPEQMRDSIANYLALQTEGLLVQSSSLQQGLFVRGASDGRGQCQPLDNRCVL